MQSAGLSLPASADYAEESDHQEPSTVSEGRVLYIDVLSGIMNGDAMSSSPNGENKKSNLWKYVIQQDVKASMSSAAPLWRPEKPTFGRVWRHTTVSSWNLWSQSVSGSSILKCHFSHSAGMISSPVKAECFRLSKHYLTPSPDADAVTDYIVSFLAFLGAWISLLDFMPPCMRMHDLKALFDFVIEMQFVLTSHVGRCCLDQRLDELLKDPGSSVQAEFETWMEELVASCEDAVAKVSEFACSLPVPDGVLFDQLAHAALLLGVRRYKFDQSDRVTNHLNALARKITEAVYKEQCRVAMADQPVEN